MRCRLHTGDGHLGVGRTVRVRREARVRPVVVGRDVVDECLDEPSVAVAADRPRLEPEVGRSRRGLRRRPVVVRLGRAQLADAVVGDGRLSVAVSPPVDLADRIGVDDARQYDVGPGRLAQLAEVRRQQGRRNCACNATSHSIERVDIDNIG